MRGLTYSKNSSVQPLRAPEYPDLDNSYPDLDTLILPAREEANSDASASSTKENELADLLEQARVQMQESGKEELLQYVEIAEGLLKDERMKASDVSRQGSGQHEPRGLYREVNDDILSSPVVSDGGVRVTSVRTTSLDGDRRSIEQGNTDELLPPLYGAADSSMITAATAAAHTAAESARAATLAADVAAAVAAAQAIANSEGGDNHKDALSAVSRQQQQQQQQQHVVASDDHVGKEDDLEAESKLGEEGQRFDADSDNHPVEGSSVNQWYCLQFFPALPKT
jgi:hypothetical protein